MLKYLPILQELFESDTVIFFIIGIAAALFICLISKKEKRICLIGMTISFAVYAVCETVSNFVGSYMAELAMLFFGTAALGALAAFLIMAALNKIRGD